MDARQFGLVRVLVDALRSGHLSAALVQARLAEWTERIVALSDVEAQTKKFKALTECGDRVAAGETTLLEQLRPNVEKIEELLDLIQDLGDLH